MQVIRSGEVAEEWTTRDDIDGEQATRHLVSRALTGTEHLVVDVARFPPGFTHHLHRHFEADQLLIAVDGPFTVLHPDGDERLEAGDVAVFPRGDWHGARNDTDETVQALVLFSGVGELVEAGYEESTR